jgi:hypothetical protein
VENTKCEEKKKKITPIFKNSKFKADLSCISGLMCRNIIVLGDFELPK